MKTTTIQFNFDESKLNAICLYLSSKNTDLDTELQEFMEAFYKKIVPSQVREFIEKTSCNSHADKSKNSPRSVTARKAICGDNAEVRTDARNS